LLVEGKIDVVACHWGFLWNYTSLVRLAGYMLLVRARVKNC